MSSAKHAQVEGEVDGIFIFRRRFVCFIENLRSMGNRPMEHYKMYTLALRIRPRFTIELIHSSALVGRTPARYC